MRRPTRIDLVASLAGLIVLGGVQGEPARGWRAQRTSDVVVTEKDAGRSIELKEGGQLVVRLASNATTGYQWEMKKPATACVHEARRPVYEPPAHALPGAGGTQVFTLRAASAGRTTLRFEYRRSWEKKAPARTFQIDVVVM